MTLDEIYNQNIALRVALDRVNGLIYCIKSGQSQGIDLTAEQIANLKAQVKAAYAQGLLAATAIGKAIEAL